ncbi:MAG TPA: type II secretion system minor pseudopilin GspI [Casimicrobiaceae bacterium]
MVLLPHRRPAEPRANRHGDGFTLVEILVALAILAVALAAGMRAVGESADSATLLKQRTLALWVAQNRLAAAQIATPWPSQGSREGEAAQAGTRFIWRENVSGTPNPSFRRIDISVADPAVPDYALARITGYIGQPAQQ